MPVKGRYKRIPRPVTAEEKHFISLVGRGMKRSKAFREAFPTHKHVLARAEAKTPEEKRVMNQRIVQASKDRLQSKHIQSAMQQYNKKMEVFTDKAVDTAIDLVEHARSEKVRADLAIEGMRHRVGTPVQKVQVQEEKNVILTFGTPHKDDKDDIIDGEVVDTAI